jgi:glutamate-ammonia-ligase adenylyltransferase
MEWIPSRSPGSIQTTSCVRAAGVALQEEARAIQTRHETIGDAMRAVRALPPRTAAPRLRRRPRHAHDRRARRGLTTVSEVTIQATLRAVRREVVARR